MKQIIVSFLCALAVLTADAQFLFRISGGGLEKPSYILGTIHTLSGAVLDSIPEYLEIEAQCQQLYAELEFTKEKASNVMGSAASLQTKEILPDGKTIYDILSKEQINMLKSVISKELKATWKTITEVKARSGGVSNRTIDDATISTRAESLVTQMQIFMPNTFMSFIDGMINMEVLMQSLDKDIMNNQLIDIVCISRAKARGMTIGELDETSDLLELLGKNNNLSLEAQVDSLARYLTTFEQHRQNSIDEVKYIKQTIEYWNKGDFDTFSTMDYLVTSAEKELTHHKKRSETWLPKMITAMHKAPTLFAFGSAHLIGPYSIIQKLRDAGYDVEQIKKK